MFMTEKSPQELYNLSVYYFRMIEICTKYLISEYVLSISTIFLPNQPNNKFLLLTILSYRCSITEKIQQIRFYADDYSYKQIKRMKHQFLLLTLLVAAFAAPKQLVKFSVSSYILPDKKLEMELDITVPRMPDTYPVILMVTGLEGLCPSYFQSNLIESIAEQGYAYISVTKLQSPNPQKITQALKAVIDWMGENMQLVFNSRAPGVIADIQNRFILIGHSAGGHVVTEYLNNTCGPVKLQILLDPVDGADPFGFKKDYVITPGKFLPYATPVLILTNELDNTRRDLFEPPCAPQNLSNDRFYNAMSGPKWMINVTKYGHIDFFNNQYRDLATVACATCKKDCNFAQYRTLVKEAILSFIDGVLYKDVKSLEVIQNAKFQIPTTFKHNYMGYDPKKGGYCVRKNGNEMSEQQSQNLQNS